MEKINKNDLISDEYQRLNAAVYNTSKRSMGGAKHASKVDEVASKWGVETILDYGCGQGQFKQELENLRKDEYKIFEYDPGITGKEKLPESPVDLVMCADVLEHIEPDKIDNVIQHIYELSKMGCYLVISLCSTKVILPDGRNAHLLIKPVEWWIQKLLVHNWEVNSCIVRIKKKEMKDLIVWIRK